MKKVELGRLIVSVPMIGSGLALSSYGLWMQTQQRTNAEDDLAWAAFGIGMFLIGAGVSLPFTRNRYAIGVGCATPSIGFMLLVALYWGAIILGFGR